MIATGLARMNVLHTVQQRYEDATTVGRCPSMRVQGCWGSHQRSCSTAFWQVSLLFSTSGSAITPR